MRWKAVSLVAAVVGLAIPASAHACYWTIDAMFHRIPTKFALGAGVSYASFDGGSTLVPAVDFGIGIAERVVIMPAVGLCKEDYDAFDGTSEPIFGAAAGIKLFSGDKFALNAQTGISMVSYDDDSKYTTIPIIAAGQLTASEKASIFFGAGLQMNSVKVASVSASDSDPMFFGGVSLNLGRSTLSGGIAGKVGDEDTDIGFNFRLVLPLGGS